MKIILILLLAIFIYADDDRHESEHHIRKDLYFLHMSSQQKSSVKEIIKSYRKRLKALHRKEESFEKDLKDTFQDENFDKARFIQNNLSIKNEIVDIEAEFFSQMHKALNKQQRYKFIQYIEDWEIE